MRLGGWYILAADKSVVGPVDARTWEEWQRPVEGGEWPCRVAEDCVDGKRVSTVFLGLDHRHFGEGPPVLFETMVFGGEGWSEESCDRYSTWQEAEAGHARAVASLMSPGGAAAAGGSS